MTNSSKNDKKRGRPKIDSEPITLRLPADLMGELDEWRDEQPIPPKRADVLRFALVEWLKGKRKLK